MQILYAVLALGGIGIVMGLLLGVASKYLAINEDSRVGEIVSALPNANCGACGYAGCSAYASAIVFEGASVNKCNVCKKEAMEKIADIMGVKSLDIKRQTAKVLCKGNISKSKKKYIYDDYHDCVSANRLAGGDKSCSYGCLGYGTCVSRCPFNAIHVVDGVAIVDEEKCTACGMCVACCPKHIIKLVPKNAPSIVMCASLDKGKEVKEHCEAGCIGCRICEKSCPENAIIVNNNLAIIDYNKCNGCGICAEKCPKNAIIHQKNL